LFAQARQPLIEKLIDFGCEVVDAAGLRQLSEPLLAKLHIIHFDNSGSRQDYHEIGPACGRASLALSAASIPATRPGASRRTSPSCGAVGSYVEPLRRTMRHHPKLLRTMLTASLMLVATAGAGVAGPVEDAWAAYQRGDYATALGLWRPLAEQGDADAQFRVGVLYVLGQGGVPQDLAEAAKWYRKAADQGDAKGQAGLGNLYENDREHRGITARL
jgi:hypothetical protein